MLVVASGYFVVVFKLAAAASGGSAVACAAFGLYELSEEKCGAAASGVVACARWLCLAVGRTAHTISGCRACSNALRGPDKLAGGELVVEYASLVDKRISTFFPKWRQAPSARAIETSKTLYVQITIEPAKPPA